MALLLVGASTACTSPSATGVTPGGTASSSGSAGADASKEIPAAPKVDAVAEKLPAAVKSKGSLVVAMDPTRPPFQFFAQDNKTVVGSEVELARALAQTMGLKLEIAEVGFDTIIPGVQSGKYDIGISGFGDTKKREEGLDMVTYLYGGAGLMVPAGNPAKVSIKDPCGKRIGAMAGSIQGTVYLPQFSEECVKGGKTAVTINIYPNAAAARLALGSGRIDAVLSDSVSLTYQSKTSKGQFEMAGDDDYKPIPYGIALQKGSPLVEPVKAAVQAIMDSGLYKQILAKWSVDPFAIGKSVINGAA
jgi:polar amino acid transport system substrate-binding protein